MKYTIGLVVWFIITLFTWTCQADLNIAIIGGGIGGTSCAYYLQQLFQNSLNIDIYEGNKVGGRLDTFVLSDGKEYEIGGSIIHTRNRYMMDFSNMLNLERRSLVFQSEKLGLYNGVYFDFIEKENYMYNYMSIYWRYGYSVKRLKTFINEMLDKFDKIYELQNTEESFESVSDLLSAMDPKFADYLNVSVKDAFLVNDDYSETVINELVQGSLRVNYGQNISVHEFVGAVSMAGMEGQFWGIKGGNKRVPENLLNKTRKVNLINEYVTHITKNENSYTLNTTTNKNATYDYVVFAAPLAVNQRVPITFTNFEIPLNNIGKYHRTVCTLVVGKVNMKRFFPLTDGSTPFIVISNNEDEHFNSISNIGGVHENDLSLNVFKIFSQKPLTTEQLEEVFDQVYQVKVMDWMAYPHYTVPTTPHYFQISDRFYHINAIEWAASAMEMICIGSKNVALLIKKHDKELSNISEQSRSEL